MFLLIYVINMIGLSTVVWDFYDEDEKGTAMLLGLFWPLFFIVLIFWDKFDDHDL